MDTTTGAAGVLTSAVGQRPSTDSMTSSLDVSVVLPCLNEEKAVGGCVRDAQEAIHRAGWSGEVIVVDNGSTDDSITVALAAGARVVHEAQRGYGAAIQRGVREALGRVVVMADADATYPLERLDEVVMPVLRGQVNLMLGSRLDAATRHSMPFLHRFVGTPVLTWLVGNSTGTRHVTDSQSGFRAFERNLVSRLGLRAPGMEFASEMLIRAAHQGIAVGEVPLGYGERVGESKLSTWSDGMRHLRLILRLSPHLFLWLPGLAALVLGLLVYGLALLGPQAPTIGELTWQPVFFGTILVVLGMIAAMSGALLARYSPLVSEYTRESFAWVSLPRTVTVARRAGWLTAAVGLALDGLLFVLWVSDSSVDEYSRLHLAGMAQGLILDGVLLGASVSVISLVVANHAELALAVQDPD